MPILLTFDRAWSLFIRCDPERSRLLVLRICWLDWGLNLFSSSSCVAFAVMVLQIIVAVVMFCRSLSSFAARVSQCWSARRSWHSRTWSLVLLSSRHKGHLLWVHSFCIFIIFPTAQCPELNLEIHSCLENGSHLIAFSLLIQLIKWDFSFGDPVIANFVSIHFRV
jgi:hypothetical protein